MSVQCAARFAPPPPVESTAGLSASGRPHGSSARRGLGTGTVLLLAGGAAASAWAAPASADAQVEAPAPDEQRESASDLPVQSPRTAVGSPVSPLWSAATMPGTLDAAPIGAATAESAPIVHASPPQTSPERIQDRLAQAAADSFRTPAARAQLAQLGFLETPPGPEPLRARIAEEFALHRELMARAGIQPE